MGTRNLTIVVHRGVNRIAQYGQWDGYPSGQGMTCLKFCRENLATAEGRERFAAKLDQVSFISAEELKQLYDSVLGRDTSENDWLTSDEADLFKRAHPQFSRDLGAEILELVLASVSPLKLNDQTEFAGDGLMCEFAWVIDLDKLTFEMFEGFGQTSLAAGERFHYLQKEPCEYYPVHLKAQFKLDDLPDEQQFLTTCESSEPAAQDDELASTAESATA